MWRQSKSKLKWKQGSVIGVVQSPRGLAIAKRLRPDVVDAIELRSDHFDVLPADAVLAKLPVPMIATARHPAEGGAGGLSVSARRVRLFKLIEFASAVDIELRSLPGLADVARAARGRGVLTIFSFHDFKGTPPGGRLRDLVRRAADEGADVVKIATTTRTAAEVARLLELLQEARGVPLSVMGMGPLGMASRLLFASCGSVLNYGWLDKPAVPGQWPAPELKALLQRL